ncbi:hypothetical protein [Variovorax boronicumulans]|uniref:hypothetical protein n=1 Tax=Variovorax boronicumulans TaxID=436515 RepID=UPI003395EB1F
MQRITSAFVAMFCIAGCTDSAINAVKNASPRSGDFTYEQALDNSKGCQKTSWAREADSNGRPVVLYSCTLAATDDKVTALKQESETSLLALKNRLTGYRLDMVEQLKKNQIASNKYIDDYKAYQADILTNLRRQITDLQTNPISGSASLIAGLERQIAEKTAKADEDLAEYMRKRSYLSVDRYSQLIAQIEGWKARYEAAVDETIASEHAKMENFYKDDSKRNLELRIQFLVQNKGAVQPLNADWFQNGVALKIGVDPIVLAAVFLNPKRLEEVADMQIKNQLTYRVPDEYSLNFPIVCGPDVPDGCGPRKL